VASLQKDNTRGGACLPALPAKQGKSVETAMGVETDCRNAPFFFSEHKKTLTKNGRGEKRIERVTGHSVSKTPNGPPMTETDQTRLGQKKEKNRQQERMWRGVERKQKRRKYVQKRKMCEGNEARVLRPRG